MPTTSPLVPGIDIGMTMWTSLNPFEEPTSFAMVHPHSAEAGQGLAGVASGLGMKRLDQAGDIMPLTPDKMFVMVASLCPDQ